MRSSLIFAFVLLGACGDNRGAGVDAPSAPIDGSGPDGTAVDAADPDGAVVDAQVIDAPAIDGTAIDAPTDAFPTTTIELAGPANGLYWDAAASTLYLNNATADTLVRYTDGAGLQTVGTWPSASSGISLGDVVKRADGRYLTPNFGFGTQGALFAMTEAGVSTQLTGPAVNRRRVGLAQDSLGALWVTYFIGGGGGSPTGGLASVAIVGDAAVETDLVTSLPLKKLVGLVATPTALFVTDQTDGLLYKVALPLGTVTTVAALPTPDLLTIMPNGDLISGGTAGTGVRRITQAGVVTTIFTGFDVVHGVAYDPAGHRLFFVEHSATVGIPDKLQIRALN